MNEIEQVYYEVITPTLKLINDHELDIAKLSRIHIPEVKSVLRAKVGTAQQQQIKVMLDIPEKIATVSMPIVPFIRIISVLLDNATEEAVHSEEKVLQIAFLKWMQSNILLFVIAPIIKRLICKKFMRRIIRVKKRAEDMGYSH